jgi:outer membrane protein assembly factor BamD (BamD/ComL family)
MKTNRLFSFLFITISLVLFSSLQAAKPKLFRSKEDAQIYMAEHYNKGCQEYNQEHWRQAAKEFEKITFLFPDSEAAANTYYYLGVCFFQMREYDFASYAFSNYLKAVNHPEFFEDAVYYKFCIAEHFKCGQKRRLFKMRYCPKWATGRSLALETYDEVIAALPNHELAASALYSKGCLLQTMEEYRDSVDAFQTLIRRFPKHELTPQCYLQIAEAYCQQSRYEFQNPDLLALAEINVRKFSAEFPRDERVAVAEGYVARIKENYAKGLCDIGKFYERVCLPDAAVIYYQSSIEEFPDTAVAGFCRARLIYLGYECPEEEEIPSSPCDFQPLEEDSITLNQPLPESAIFFDEQNEE